MINYPQLLRKLGTMTTMESSVKPSAPRKDEYYLYKNIPTVTQDESKYVDFENSGETKCGTLSEGRADTGDSCADQSKTLNARNGDMEANEGHLEPALSSEVKDEKDCLKSQDADNPEVNTQHKETDRTASTDNGDLEYTDMYLSRTSDSDDDVSVVLSDDCVPSCITEDESHYITTHEIQLSELSDHEVDYDIGVGSCWDMEDDNQVYSFVDYASFDGDETTRERGENVKGKQGQSNSGAAVSSLLENDICAKAKCTSTDECLEKCSEKSEGQIHLSIKTTSRAINEPSNIQEKENIMYHAKHAGDMSHYVFRRADAKGDKLYDSAKCFIAAPGRLHFGRKLKGKDVNDHSSGASSAVSELDDADKEVRNLTAKAFKSLAYPYFDAINFSTSSESSASEHGLGINRWSTFVDLKYGNMNMSQGREQNMVSHKTSSFEIAKNKNNKGYKGITNMKPPPSKIFNLNNPHNTSSSTKKIELKGKFGQGHSGVITLTETLNFRCNVKSGVSADRRLKFAQNAIGSRSTDEVTNTLPSRQGSGATKLPCNAGETMEDTHKKAIFASSLLKNVISKKMQFEQERKMERGEISEPYQVPSPSFLHQESETTKENLTQRESRDLQRQYSEGSSDYTIVCVDELGDIVDSGSSDARSERRRQDPLTQTHASENNLESTNEAGFDTKKGAFEAAKGTTLLPSQNSAFRSWREGELEFQKERKNDKTPEWKVPSAKDNLEETDLYADSGNSKLTKMSHLFVPSIQLLSSEGEVEKQLQTMNYSTGAQEDHGEEGGMLRPDNTLYVADPTRRLVTSKSPEIKINLRRLKDNKGDMFNISKLPVPNIGCNTANMIKAAQDSRCHALAAVLKGESDRIPHFMVRDIRENNKGKLQTPIHQVRDVRKLVKSSYHFVSLDNNDKPSAADLHSEQRVLKQGPHRNPTSLSPIVIKCQSVNTNTGESVNLIDPSKRRLSEDTFEIDRSSPEVTKTGTVQRPTGRVPTVNKRRDSLEGPIGLKIETRTPSRRQDKTPDTTEKKPESKIANVAALEKLQAAVKTMEQLYVFDRNEWKRKSVPHTITDSHVLSMITTEEHGGPEDEEVAACSAMPPSSSMPPSSMDTIVRRDSYPNTDKTPPVGTASLVSEIISKKVEKELQKTFHVPTSHEERNGPKWPSQQGGSATGNKNMLNFSTTQKASINTTSSINETQPHVICQAPYSTKGFCTKSPKVPVSLRTPQPRHPAEEMERLNGSEARRPATQTHSNNSAESENYLTIPVKSHATSTKSSARSAREKASLDTARAKTQTGIGLPEHTSHATAAVRQEESRQSPQRSTIVMEARSQDTPTATIYHHSLPMAMSSAQPQMICFSPTMAPSPAMDHFQATQRKMLLDPTTGNYYLVDTPVQPATKRLFDPETGQYVDVPMPQSPMTPMPMSMPVSPLALSPGAYGHTYMIYPGFMPAPTMIPARMQSQMSMQSEADDGDKGSHCQQSENVYMESPYYMATGKSPQAQQQGSAARAPQGYKQPVISITSQQGPRIIAPPSFDGTTMSFVVEHR